MNTRERKIILRIEARKLLIDVSRADLQAVSATGEQLDRPWLTTLTDQFSRRVLSASVSIERPSYIGAMKTLIDLNKITDEL